MNIIKSLIEGGAFTLPFLLHIYDAETDIYLIDDNADLIYNGHTYKAGSFEYMPNANGDATLEISFFDNPALANLINRSRIFNCELIGAYNGAEVVPLGAYRHQYGDATWDGDKLQIKLNADDRENMTFPALIYNNYNNRGA